MLRDNDDMRAGLVRLRTNARTDPRGIDDPTPEFSWTVEAAPGVHQTGYRVTVAQSDGTQVWDSGEVAEARPYGIRYAGRPLTSSTTYHWTTQVLLSDGSAAESTATFETGVLDPTLWVASWITDADSGATDDTSALYLRGDLHLDQPIARACAYASALGWYRLLVNGADLTGPSLVPRWTPLDQVVEYQSYDLSEHLTPGRNIIAMAVGDGRYRGSLGFRDARRVYGDHLAGFVQLELVLADGTSRTWTTGHEWVAGPGRIMSSDPKKGERTDLRVPDDDWSTSPRTPPRLRPARVLPRHGRHLVAEDVERVRAVDRLPATRIWRSPTGKQLVDFGQNAAGVVRIRLDGPAGMVVALTHSEVLTVDGELDDDYVHGRGKTTWTQRDEVTLDGTPQTCQPWFTIHGFRYVEVQGLSYDLDADDIEMVVISTDLESTGWFDCSDDRLTRLWRNIEWSTRSNFVDTPTDCPTRERSGWTGDIQVFAPTATRMVDVQAYLRRYLGNLAMEQQGDGRVPPFIPAEASTESTSRATWALGRLLAGSVGWGDAAVLVPAALHDAYGDERVLAQQYDSMRSWVDFQARRARGRRGLSRLLCRRAGHLEAYVLDSGFHWGEWLRPGEHFPANAFEGTLRGAVVATAYLAHSAQTLAHAAGVLGRGVDETYYGALAGLVREAWRAAFVSQGGRKIGTDRQDDYVRALAFDLLLPDQREAAMSRLVDLVEGAGDHLQTGFLSTPLLLPVLSRNGRLDLAYRLLLQDTRPSWLHQVGRGATTIWETWEGYDEAGKAQASHNHYALGAVGSWLHSDLLGIRPTTPGFHTACVAPRPGGGITWAAGGVVTPHGTLDVRWDLLHTEGVLELSIPSGMSVEVVLPDGTHHPGCESGHHRLRWDRDEARGTR